MKRLHPDVTALLADPEMGAQQFSVERTITRFKDGRSVSEVNMKSDMVGSIQPGGPDDIKHFPEGDRLESIIVISTTRMLYSGDIVYWNRRKYKVHKVDMWVDHGFCTAYAVMES